MTTGQKTNHPYRTAAPVQQESPLVEKILRFSKRWSAPPDNFYSPPGYVESGVAFERKVLEFLKELKFKETDHRHFMDYAGSGLKKPHCDHYFSLGDSVVLIRFTSNNQESSEFPAEEEFRAGYYIKGDSRLFAIPRGKEILDKLKEKLNLDSFDIFGEIGKERIEAELYKRYFNNLTQRALGNIIPAGELSDHERDRFEWQNAGKTFAAALLYLGHLARTQNR